MSIKIPISADPSSTVSALDQISAAIRKAGQEGRKFSEIDFSHEELKPFADDIKQLQENFEELKKIGRGATAAAVRSGGYDDVLQWHKGYSRQFPDAKKGQNHRDAVSNYVSQGTSWEQSQTSGAGDKNSGGGKFGGLPVPGMGKMLGIGLGLAGIGKVTSMLSEGINGAQDEAVDIDTFKRTLNDTATDFDSMRESIRQTSDGLQLTYNETVKLAQSFAKASAFTDVKRVNKEVEMSSGFARSFGLDPNQVTQQFGQARWMRLGGGSEAGPKEMAMMLAEAIGAGNMWSKADQVLGAVLGYVESSENKTVDAPNVKGYLALTSAMNASDHPGLQGQSGTTLVSQMDTAIRNGGSAGDAGQNFLWRALNPDNDMDPFQMRLKQEEGMFGKLEDGRTNYEAILETAQKMYANPLQRADALSRLYGTTMTQMLAMMEIEPNEHGRLSQMMGDFNIDPKTINSTAYQGLADVAIADNEGLERIRRDTLNRGDLTNEQKKTVQDAKSGTDLREVLAKTLAVIGREKNTGTETLDAVVSVKNAVVSTGEKLLGPVNTIKDLVAEIADVPKVFDKVEDAVGVRDKSFDLLKQPDSYFKGIRDPTVRRVLLRKRKRLEEKSSTENNKTKEIKVLNEVVVVHKNESGNVLREEHLPTPNVIPVSE